MKIDMHGLFFEFALVTDSICAAGLPEGKKAKGSGGDIMSSLYKILFQYNLFIQLFFILIIFPVLLWGAAKHNFKSADKILWRGIFHDI